MLPIYQFAKPTSFKAAVICAMVLSVSSVSGEILGTWPENLVNDAATAPMTFANTSNGTIEAELGDVIVRGVLNEQRTEFTFAIFMKNDSPTGVHVADGQLRYAQTPTRERWLGHFDLKQESADASGEASSLQRFKWELRRNRGGDVAGGGTDGGTGDGMGGGTGGGVGDGIGGGTGGTDGGFSPVQQSGAQQSPKQSSFGKDWGKRRSTPATSDHSQAYPQRAVR